MVYAMLWFCRREFYKDLETTFPHPGQIYKPDCRRFLIFLVSTHLKFEDIKYAFIYTS